MIFADAKAAKRFAPFLARVLVVDPQPASTRLIHELMKDLGARYVAIENTAGRALTVARQEDPQLILTEYSGTNFDGLEFVRAMRRSDLNCRQAPVIMITSEATTSAITGARDAGVHEFLRKPFTIKDLIRRLETVTLRSRDWVEGVRYIGPDRRRFNSGDYAGPRRRQTEAPTPDAVRVHQALRILRAALGAIESDPRQAMRAMQAQAVDLTKAAVGLGDANLATASAGLQYCLQETAELGVFNRARIEAACTPLWSYLPDDAAEEKAA